MEVSERHCKAVTFMWFQKTNEGSEKREQNKRKSLLLLRPRRQTGSGATDLRLYPCLVSLWPQTEGRVQKTLRTSANNKKSSSNSKALLCRKQGGGLSNWVPSPFGFVFKLGWGLGGGIARFGGHRWHHTRSSALLPVVCRVGAASRRWRGRRNKRRRRRRMRSAPTEDKAFITCSRLTQWQQSVYSLKYNNNKTIQYASGIRTTPKQFASLIFTSWILNDDEAAAESHNIISTCNLQLWCVFAWWCGNLGHAPCCVTLTHKHPNKPNKSQSGQNKHGFRGTSNLSGGEGTNRADSCCCNPLKWAFFSFTFSIQTKTKKSKRKHSELRSSSDKHQTQAQ